MQELEIAYFPGTVSKVPRQEMIPWPDLVKLLSRFERRPEKEGPMWSPISLIGKRTLAAKNVAYVSCLVLDYDFGIPPPAVRPLWEAFTYLIHSTHSNTPETPKWRAVFPFEQHVLGAEYGAVWSKLVYHLAGGYPLDVKCKDPSRKWFLPSFSDANADVSYALVHGGKRLDPFALPDPPPAPKRAPASFSQSEKRAAEDRLLQQALDRADRFGRNNGAYHLGQQAAWNGYSPMEVENLVQAYIQLVAPTNLNGKPEEFTLAEGLRAAMNGAATPRREPWAEVGAKGGAATAAPPRRSRPKDDQQTPGNGRASTDAPPPDDAPESSPGASDEAGKQASGKQASAAASEQGLGHRFAEQMRGVLMTTDGGAWWRYREGVWTHLDRHAVLAQVERYLEAFTTQGQYARLVEAVTKIAGFRLHIPLARLNSHPEWVPLKNGVLDTRDRSFRDHAPGNLLTVQLPYAYDPDASCPNWLKFLSEVLVDEKGATSLELVQVVQEWFGYCLIPDSRAQTSMWWLGGGANGKGVATKVLSELVGRTNTVGVDIEQLHEPYQRAALYGKLLGVVGEIPLRAMMKNGERFKEIVSGDQINGRQPGKEFFDFIPTVRILCTANELPKSHDRAFGYFRRLLLIWWHRSLPAEEQDRALADKLLLEMPGILNWSLDGLYRLQAQGFHFSHSELAAQELEKYRHEEDAVARFIDEWCDRKASGFELFSDLWDAYQRWCKVMREDPGTANAFARSLTRLGMPPAVKWSKETNRPDKGRSNIELVVRSWDEPGPGLYGR